MKFGPIQRAAITAGVILLAFAFYGVWRMLDSHGVFTTVTSGFAGTCRAVKTAAGVQDIVFDGNTAILSVVDRRAKSKLSPRDGLYLYDPAKPSFTKLSGTPADFHPGALGLYRAPNAAATLFVVNRRQSGEYGIEMFAFDGKSLKETGEIESGLIVDPKAIAAVDSQSFYVANERTDKTAFGRWLADTFALPRGDVLYFDGMKFLEVAKTVNSPAGIELSPDAGQVYVAEAYGRALATFERNPFTGQLKEAGQIAIPANLGKVHLGPDGALWIAGSSRAGPAKTALSVVYRVSPNGGVPQNAKLVYANLGEEIGAASTAASANGRLLIGSEYGDKLLDCKLP